MSKASNIFERYIHNQIYPDCQGVTKQIKLDDAHWKRIKDALERGKGDTWRPRKDGTPKVIWEGHGLKKFPGKFFPPKPAGQNINDVLSKGQSWFSELANE